MKQYLEEQHILDKILKNKSISFLSNGQMDELNHEFKKIINQQKKHKTVHQLLQALPFILIIVQWFILLTFIPKITSGITLLITIGLLHGYIGYQWVIYGIHEGAGHGLFKELKNPLGKILSFLAFNSSRLMMADPINYQKNHHSHHSYLGTNKDGSQVNYVKRKRILKSLLPGAGIFFKNDYCVHVGEKIDFSTLISLLIGLLRFLIEYNFLKNYLSLTEIIFSLLVISPWIGLTLDRIRESVEHFGMPKNNKNGSKELGLGIQSMIICGGPWGQPFHLSHHLYPSLKWYQQIQMGKKLSTILTKEQNDFYIVKSIIKTFLKQLTFQKEIEKNFLLEAN